MSDVVGADGLQLNRWKKLRYDPGHEANGTATSAKKTRGGRSGRKQFSQSQLRSNDMEVRGPGSVSGASPVQGVKPVQVPRAVESKPALEMPHDEIELSSASQVSGKTTEATDATLRAERLARIKAEIDAGTYDSDAKLEAALLKMFNQNGIDLEG